MATTVKDISEIKVKSPTWVVRQFYAISLLPNKNTETNEQAETPTQGEVQLLSNFDISINLAQTVLEEKPSQTSSEGNGDVLNSKFYNELMPLLFVKEISTYWTRNRQR